MRIVAGAVRNAAHAHSDISIPQTFARSVAKRAAGTLTAAWPDVLAVLLEPSDNRGAQAGKPGDRAPLTSRRGARKTGEIGVGLSRLILLRKRITRDMNAIRRSGDAARHQAFVEVLRMIAELEK